MVKRFHTQHAHKKYLPKKSRWKMFCSWWKKRKRNNDIYVVKDSTKSFKSNPFNKEKPKKKSLSLKVKLIIFLILLIIWAGLMIYIPFFRITNIEIKGLENIKSSEMITHINSFLKKGFILPKSNYFLVDTNNISQNLLKEFPIREVHVLKTFPNRIDIEVKEKISSLIYNNESQYYLMDNNGSLIKHLTDVSKDEFFVITLPTSTTSTTNIAPTTTIHIPNYKQIKKEFGTYPILYDKRKKEIKLKTNNLIPIEYINNIVKFNEEFKKWGRGDIKYYIIENIGSGVEVITTNTWDVKINPENDIQTQLNNLKIVLKENKVQLYIDLRFNDRVFWR